MTKDELLSIYKSNIQNIRLQIAIILIEAKVETDLDITINKLLHGYIPIANILDTLATKEQEYYK